MSVTQNDPGKIGFCFELRLWLPVVLAYKQVDKFSEPIGFQLEHHFLLARLKAELSTDQISENWAYFSSFQ